jgi:hypothetical protein
MTRNIWRELEYMIFFRRANQQEAAAESLNIMLVVYPRPARAPSDVRMPRELVHIPSKSREIPRRQECSLCSCAI